MKKLWLFSAFVLALALPTLMVAQTPTVNQGATLTAKQITAVFKAIGKSKVKLPAAGQLVAKDLPAGSSAAVPTSTEPVIAPGLFTVGLPLADVNSSQPTPCFGCLITTDSPNTFGVTLPLQVIPSGNPDLQFVQTFENLAYNGNVTLSLVVLNGDHVLSVSSVSGGIYPSIWSVYYLVPTPTVTNTTLQAAAVITVGSINQVRAMPFYVLP
jgi:hypothetical protein